MADLISPDFKRRALARWEASVAGTRSERYLAYRAGPPNWMVLEDWKGEKVETFVAAARRVRDCYFPGGEPSVTGDISSPVGTHGEILAGTIEKAGTSTGDNCATCGDKPRERGRRECAACRKARSRRDETVSGGSSETG